MFRSAALVVFVFAVAGCKPGARDKPDVEKALQTQMTARLKVEITSVRLTQQADGTYTGTATAADGDTYDVTAAVPDPKLNLFEWTAVVTPATVERMVRDQLTAQKLDVSALDLKQHPGGRYDGTATTAAGDTYELEVNAPPRNEQAREGIVLHVTPGQVTVERMVGEDIEKQTGVKVKSFALKRKEPGVYTGTATQDNGVLTVATRMDGPKLTWTFRPRKQP